MPVAALEAVAGDWSRDLGGNRSSGRLPRPVHGLSSSPSSHTGIVSDVPGRLSSGSSLAARGRGDACQRSLRNRPRSGSRLLQSPLPGGEGDWRLEACDRSLTFERLRPADVVQDGNSCFGAVICQRGGFSSFLGSEDAYFQIPIHGSSRKLLRFMSEGTVYQFKALCFGLSTAPQVFTRVFAAVSAWAHSRGIRLLRYLDDWLVLSSLEKKAKQSIRELLSLCHTLGIVINEKKSDLVPSQSAKYLGMTINTGAGKVFPSLARVEKFLAVAERFYSMHSPPAQLWQVILGHLASLERLVPHGCLRMRSLQWHLKTQWSPESDPPSLPVALPEEARRDLSWWMVKAHLLTGVRFGAPAPDLHLYSDASSSGWGAHLLDQNVSGVWSDQEKLLHINLLEMKALFLGLQAFQEDVAGHHVTAMCDNSTVVAYVNKQGGTVSRSLCLLTSRLLRWTESFDVHLDARYLPGKSNVLADVLSRRGQVVGTEWSLHPQVARALLRVWGNPSIDLFATCLNAKLPLYCSLVPDPQTIFEDAFRHPWDDLDLYAFPRFALVGRVIARVQQSSRVVMTLVAPLWPEKEWFADLLLLLTQPPLALPCWDKLLRQPHCSLFHQGVHALKLHAWRLSSDTTESRAFREELLQSCQGSSESSSRLYQSRWKIFCGWCRGRGVAPVNATVPIVVDFLIHLRQDKGLSVSAVKGYCSALNSVLALKGQDLAASREITTLLRSFARSVNPVELRPPEWDVSLVLQSLTGAPYEPLRTCEERFLAQKTLFLLALASAKRIGELHALSYRVSHTRDWGEVSFAFVTGFVAKTQDPSSLAPRFEGFSVPALPNVRKNRNGRLLCPVRAVKVYLDRTASHRPRCERLFVTAGRSKKEIAKTTVSFWLRKTISRDYELSGTALPVPAPQARETRGIAPSILFRKNFAVDQVLKAGTWRRHTTFTRHYLRDIAHKSLDTFHLGPVVAAQSVV